MMKRTAALVLAASLLGVTGIANASSNGDVKGPGDKVGKCHLLGNGNYIYIEPSASSYVTAGHGSRNEGDVFPTFRFQQNKKGESVTVYGTADADLLGWVKGHCKGEKPGPQADPESVQPPTSPGDLPPEVTPDE